MPNCNIYKSRAGCVADYKKNSDLSSFICEWYEEIKKCMDGYDMHKKEWIDKIKDQN